MRRKDSCHEAQIEKEKKMEMDVIHINRINIDAIVFDFWSRRLCSFIQHLFFYVAVDLWSFILLNFVQLQMHFALVLAMSCNMMFILKVMTVNPECATLETTILEALHTMHDGKFLHLPVLDKGNISYSNGH